MKKHKEDKQHHKLPPSERFFNREMSRILFDRRVLANAQNKDYPLFERLRFLAISAANTDEFYAVRVAGLIGLTREGVNKISIDGKTPTEQLKEIYALTADVLREQQSTWKALKKELKQNGVTIVNAHELTPEERASAAEVFEKALFPALTPLAVDPAHPFPFIPHQGLGVLFKLRHKLDGKIIRTVITVPQQLKRFHRLSCVEGKIRYIAAEDAIICNTDKLFPSYDILGFGTFKLLRDTGIEIEEDAEDLVREFENALRRRRHGSVVRVKVKADTPEDLQELLKQELETEEEGGTVITVPELIGVSSLSQIITPERPELLFPPHNPRLPLKVRMFNGDIFKAIADGDFLLHHPYDSFDPVIHFLFQAANDPDVTAVRVTLYRTSDDSPIVKALIEAAENGKNVTAVIELKARFDEAANIRQARSLERAGAHVVFGFTDRKTHAKTACVVRREGTHFRTYVHFGTGNYHPETAKLYTDLSLFTCDETLAADSVRLFNYITGYIEPHNMQDLKIAPVTLKEYLLNAIDTERNNALAGKPSGIYAKMNSLGHAEVIEALYRASQAGVPIKLNVRGVCALKAGVPGLSENIEVTSIIGRFLEHSRIAAFANGGEYPSKDSRVYISSADWMPRNLERRVETFVPVKCPDLKVKICRYILDPFFADTVAAQRLLPDGNYERVKGASRFCAQEYFTQHPFEISGKS